MNSNNLIKNRGLLAILLGVAVIATAGVSAVYAQTSGSTDQTQPQPQTQTPPQIQGSINLQQLIQSQVKTSFVDAANSAAQAVTGGKVIGGSLSMAQGYIVYKFQVIDDSNKVYSVIVDAGNGSVLYTSQGHDVKFGAFGMGGFGGHGRMGGGAGWNLHKAPSGSAPSGTTNPTTGGSSLSSQSRL